MSQAPIITIFGISGDLASRKLLPALYHLMAHDSLDPDTKIIGITRQTIDKTKLLSDIELCILDDNKMCDPRAVRQLNDALELVTLDLKDPAAYRALKKRLDEIDPNAKRERLFYLSIPPSAYETIIEQLGEAGLNQNGHRLLVEKPFGSDTDSAQRLIESVGRYYDESQIYRIDHYLAKETAQNLLTFRMHNPIFSSLWNASSIESIQVRAMESIGVENRIDFYENTGALRDIIQGHLLQILSLVMMERPKDDSSESIHHEKVAFLESLEPADPNEAVRGQYEGYRDEVSNPDSIVETYARVTLRSTREAWSGVPIILETGKALSEKTNEVVVQFRQEHERQRNRLTFLLQPKEGISLDLVVKRPGLEDRLQHAALDLSYDSVFDTKSGHPDAYERVLMDAIRGDQSLFASDEEVVASWNVVQPLLDVWSNNGDGLREYSKGSTGPA